MNTVEIKTPSVFIPHYGPALAPLCVVKETVADDDPVFHPAYIDIDVDAGEIEAGDPESGNLERLGRGSIIRIPVPSTVSGKALEEYLESEEFLALYQRVKAGHTDEPADDLGHFDDDARWAAKEIEMAMDDLPRVTIWNVGIDLALHFDGEITAATTDDELRAMAETFRETARENEGALVGGDVFEALVDLRARLADDEN